MATVRHFEHNGKHYRHEMDLTTDSITLVDQDDNELVIYQADSVVGDLTMHPVKRLGRFSIEDNFWVFKEENGAIVRPGFSFDLVEGLLDAEVEISKKYLEARIGQ